MRHQWVQGTDLKFLGAEREAEEWKRVQRNVRAARDHEGSLMASQLCTRVQLSKSHFQCVFCHMPILSH